MLQRIRKRRGVEPDSPASEQELFESIVKEALEEADSFTASTKQKARLLQIDNINPWSGRDPHHRVSPEHIAALIETLYVGFGAEPPAGDLTKWTYDASHTEHIAVTPTDFGFDIVETRFRLEESDPGRLPSPMSCGFFTLDLVRPSQ